MENPIKLLTCMDYMVLQELGDYNLDAVTWPVSWNYGVIDMASIDGAEVCAQECIIPSKISF